MKEIKTDTIKQFLIILKPDHKEYCLKLGDSCKKIVTFYRKYFQEVASIKTFFATIQP